MRGNLIQPFNITNKKHHVMGPHGLEACRALPSRLLGEEKLEFESSKIRASSRASFEKIKVLNLYLKIALISLLM